MLAANTGQGTQRIASSPRRDIGTFAIIFGALAQPSTGLFGLTFTPILMRKLIIIDLKLFQRHCPGHFGPHFDVVSCVSTHMTTKGSLRLIVQNEQLCQYRIINQPIVSFIQKSSENILHSSTLPQIMYQCCFLPQTKFFIKLCVHLVS